MWYTVKNVIQIPIEYEQNIYIENSKSYRFGIWGWMNDEEPEYGILLRKCKINLLVFLYMIFIDLCHSSCSDLKFGK